MNQPCARDVYSDADGRSVWTSDQMLSTQHLERALAALGRRDLPPGAEDLEHRRMWLLGLLTATVAEQSMHIPHTPEAVQSMVAGLTAQTGRALDDAEALAVVMTEWMSTLAVMMDRVATGDTHVAAHDPGNVFGFFSNGMYTLAMLAFSMLLDPNPYAMDAKDQMIFRWLASAQTVARYFYPDQAKVYDARVTPTES